MALPNPFAKTNELVTVSEVSIAVKFPCAENPTLVDQLIDAELVMLQSIAVKDTFDAQKASSYEPLW